MFKPYPLFIGLRYASTGERSQLVSFISLISMLGMALSVALLILVLSVMNGFDREMRTRILGLVPHILVGSHQQTTKDDQVEQLILAHPGVEAIAPYMQFNAMVLRGTAVEGVQVIGIDPERERRVSILEQYISPEHLDALSNQSDRIIIGSAIAERLGIEQGGKINLMVPTEEQGQRMQPRFSRLTVEAVFHTGTEIDQGLALIAIGKAKSLLPEDKAFSGLRISLADIFMAPQVAWELMQTLPMGYNARDWTRTHGNLYSAIQLSKQLVGLMLTTIIAVAAFNVVSALVMIVRDKRGDIAILRTAGASHWGILQIFMTQGTAIALIGTLLGSVIGIALSLGITELVSAIEALFGIQFLKSDVYPVDYLPADLRLQDVLLVCSTAFIMSVLATIYPSWQAVRVQPAEALRHE